MSGGFFFEYVVEAMLNLEQQTNNNNNTNAESKSPKADSVKKPKKK